MKILLLTKKFPFPLKDGESVAVHSLSKALDNKGCEIDLLSMNTSKHFVEVDKVRDHLNQYKAVETCFVDNRIKLVDAAKNLFTKRSYHIERFDLPAFHQQIKILLEKKAYDLVLMESIYLAPYIPTVRKNSSAKIILRAHNVEHEIWERVSKNTLNPLKRTYLEILTKRLKDYELDRLNAVDGIITFTERDDFYFKRHKIESEYLISPIGIDSKAYTISEVQKNVNEIAFIGSLDWQPNIEGLKWFVEKVWPKILAEEPQSKLHIAGRNPVYEVINLASDHIIVHGEVPDAAAYVSSYPISIVPLISGGGMRVKILEAMALKRAIVSTTVGAEGIRTDGIKIGDTPDDFARAVLEMIKNPQDLQAAGETVYRSVVSHYDNKANSVKILQYLKSMQER